MKIMLSAYACEPGKGSEPAVGWNWASELARKGNEVYVLTRENNKTAILKEMKKIQCDKINFIFYDLPMWLRWWKKGRRGVHLYYLFWQMGIYFKAKSLNNKISFDIIHHVTFVSVRQPSFLGLLGVPFIFGPVAGGERAPFALSKSFPLHGWLKDIIRDLVNQWVRFSPLMRLTFSQSKIIYVTSEQTKRLIPKKFHKKTLINLAIGSDISQINIGAVESNNKSLHILYAGQLLYWKGIHFALHSFSILLTKFPDARFTILGKGPDEQWLRQLASHLCIEHAIIWLEWLPRNEVNEVYKRHDVFLFPSLHDSGGMVALEAMSNGLPVVCLDLGGPGIIVDETCGYRITTDGQSVKQVVNKLAEALWDYANSETKKSRLTLGAFKRAGKMGWSTLVSDIYNDKLIDT